MMTAEVIEMAVGATTQRKPARAEERMWTTDEIAMRWHRSTRYVQGYFKNREGVLKQGTQRKRLLVPHNVLEIAEQEQKARTA